MVGYEKYVNFYCKLVRLKEQISKPTNKQFIRRMMHARLVMNINDVLNHHYIGFKMIKKEHEIQTYIRQVEMYIMQIQLVFTWMIHKLLMVLVSIIQHFLLYKRMIYHIKYQLS